MPEEALRRVGFHDVNETVIERALPLMAQRQATEPFMAKFVVSEENFGSVPVSAYEESVSRTIDGESRPRRMRMLFHSQRQAGVRRDIR